MGADRRKRRRFPVRIDAHCRGTTHAGMGQLSDLSAGGCRVTTSVPLALGDPAVFTMFFDNGLIMVSGRVVAVGANSVSVRFENMTASTQEQLDAFLATLNRNQPLALRTGVSASPRSM